MNRQTLPLKRPLLLVYIIALLCLFNTYVNADPKKVLVTGASRGIGLEIVKLLARDPEKYTVYGTYRREPKPDVVGVQFFQADFSTRDETERFLKEFDSEVGSISVLVNNAGMAVFGPIEIISRDDIEYQVVVNLLSPMFLMNHFLPEMREQSEGCIINISSVSGMKVFPFMDVYGASKFGLEGITAAMRSYTSEIDDDAKIRCYIVQPGYTKTDIRTGSKVHKPVGEEWQSIWSYTEKAFDKGFSNGQPSFEVAETVKKAIEDESYTLPLRIQTNEKSTDYYRGKGCDVTGDSLYVPFVREGRKK